MKGTWQLYNSMSARPRAFSNAFRLCGIPTIEEPLERHGVHHPCCTSLDLLLQGRDGVCFHNCLCWLCLDLNLLSENVANAGFRCWLHTGLDTAEAWKREYAVLLDLRGCHGHQAPC